MQNWKLTKKIESNYRGYPEYRFSDGSGNTEQKDWDEVKETQTAYWFRSSSGEIISVPK